MYRAWYYCQILTKVEFTRHISEKSEISNSMKIHPVGTGLFCVNGWMGRQT